MGTNELRNIHTVNYFDTYLTGEHLLGSIDDIQTPCFDKLLLDQRYGPKDLYWFQAMLGRTLHDVGTMDDWKVSLYIHGVAGSWNSTILRLWSEVYPEHMVGFSTQTDHATTRFQSYAFGEEVKMVPGPPYTAQVIFTSTNTPPFDTHRRLLIFRFEEPVRDSVPLLMSKCRAELPFFMIKCARRYLDAVAIYKGQRSIWEKDVLPIQCRRNSSSPIVAFFESGVLETGDTYIMTFAELKSTYEEYLNTMPYTSPKNYMLDRSELVLELCRLNSILHEKGPYNPVKYPELARFDILAMDALLPVGQRNAARIYGMHPHHRSDRFF
jgi:hypothetical protein